MPGRRGSDPQAKAQDGLGGFAYVLGGLSFIPALGVVFGASAITWGLVTRKQGGRRLACIGAAGIACTVVMYGALFYFGFMQRGGVYDDLRLRGRFRRSSGPEATSVAAIDSAAARSSSRMKTPRRVRAASR